jgi:hypothetical protein
LIIKIKSFIYFFHSDEIGIKDAVNYPHRYLDSLDGTTNASNQKMPKHNTTSPGIAVKKKRQWWLQQS